MRAGWVKRVPFLADRTALMDQAVNAFKTNLPDSAPVNLVREGSEDGCLVPPRGVSAPLKFAREGIKHDGLSGAEKDDWGKPSSPETSSRARR